MDFDRLRRKRGGPRDLLSAFCDASHAAAFGRRVTIDGAGYFAGGAAGVGEKSFQLRIAFQTIRKSDSV